MKKLILAGVVTVSILLLIMLSYKKPETDANTLIVGTNSQFPPFEFIQEGTLVGFDIDLMNEIGKHFNKKIVYKDTSFDALLLEAQTGSIHIIAAGLTPTPERAKKIAFTKPYLHDDKLVVITRINNPITSLKDLANKEVIVNEGYTAEHYMAKHQDVILKRLATPAEAFLALTTDRGFAYVSALNPVKPFFERYGQDAFAIFPLDTVETAALGVSPSYPELVPALQKVLDELEADGTLAILKKKWGLS